MLVKEIDQFDTNRIDKRNNGICRVQKTKEKKKKKKKSHAQDGT